MYIHVRKPGFKCYDWSLLLYGVETWILKMRTYQQIESILNVASKNNAPILVAEEKQM